MTLEDKLKTLPKDPGVYLMKDAKGTIIYVGKAKNLKSRVTSYFNKGDHSIKTRALVNEILDFELMLTHNEVEALLLERTLIKHHKPRFNILLRDDKEYPFVRVDFQETWPRLEKVRRRKDDGAVYIGPFANAGMLNVMLNTVMRIFPLIRCSRHEFKTAQRPCNYFHIKMCLGPCTMPVDRDQYITMVKNAVALLEGKNRKLLSELTQKMKASAKDENYELAAHFRDQITALEKVAEKQTVVTRTLEDADIVHVYETPDELSFEVMMVRSSMVMGGDNFIIKKGAETTEDAFVSFLLQYYDRRMLPSLLILPFTPENLTELMAALGERDQKVAKARIARPGEESNLLNMTLRNAQHHYEERQNDQERGKVELEWLKETLHLSKLPRRMECIDISNLQGNHIVASNVCFVNGKPAKEFYRLYNIETVTGTADDFASIAEVVTRRLRRAQQDGDTPDLLIIDGGKGQLSAAADAAAAFPELDFDLVSLAKSKTYKDDTDATRAAGRSPERVFLPDQDTPIPLPEATPQYRLMTQIRDEAHRFAITFHRKKRGKAMSSSLLDQIPGIGPTLRKRLLETFGGLDNLQRASMDQLMEVKGMKESVAIAIKSFLSAED